MYTIHMLCVAFKISKLILFVETEATFEVLPRLNEIKFGSGVIDELLFLDLPREYRFPSGIMVLEYGQAVQESIYEQLRVVREGQLKVIFTPDLKVIYYIYVLFIIYCGVYYIYLIYFTYIYMCHFRY